MTKKECVLNFFLCAICACAVFFSVSEPAVAAEAAFSALSLCARKVVPGVFLFMVAAKALAACGGARLFSGITRGALEKLFHVSESGAAVIFLGLLSGYPSAAAVAASFIKSGALTRGEAERILPFATAASPAFLLACVGSLCGGKEFGAVMLFSQVGSALLLLFLTRGGSPERAAPCAQAPVRPLAALTAAIRESGAAALNICSFVTFFYVFSTMLFSILPRELCSGFAGALIAGLLEISCGFARLGALEGAAARFFCGGFILGFSGFSVMLQSADAAGAAGISMKKYLRGKLAQAFLCALFALAFGGLLRCAGEREAFFFFFGGKADIYSVWQIAALFLLFCAALVVILLVFIKFLSLFKKIFKKLWKKINL